MHSSRSTKRRSRAIESFKSAAADLAPIEKGMSLFAVTRGQWSMIDAILVVLDSVPGPCAISLWTWTIAEYEVQCLSRLMRDKRLSCARLIIDLGARNKNAAIIDQWIATFGQKSVCYVVNHSKIATIRSGDGGKYLLRGSMNLNNNPRFEQFDITEGGLDFDLVESIENDLPTQPDPSFASARSVSKIHASWTHEQLEIFQGLKPWSK